MHVVSSILVDYFLSTYWSVVYNFITTALLKYWCYISLPPVMRNIRFIKLLSEEQQQGVGYVVAYLE